MTPSPYITATEAALLLHCSPSTIRRHAEQHRIRYTRTPGGHRRYLREDVQALAAPAGGAA